MTPMDTANMQTACVLGAGTMGHGIAHVLAAAGFTTRLFDVADTAVTSGLAKVRANLDNGVEKGKVSAADRDATLARLSGATDLATAARGADVVIEAVPEKLELKRSLFAQLGDLGYVIEDAHVPASIQVRKPLRLEFPHSEASRCIDGIADTILNAGFFHNERKDSCFVDLMGALKRSVVGAEA
jgi:predicted dinucleotide-binding enzyme